MKLSETLFSRVDREHETSPMDDTPTTWGDVLLVVVVAAATALLAFDLAVRASDPYDIKKPRQRITPASRSFPARAGHYVASTPVADLSQRVPFGIQSSRDTEVPYGPVTAYTSQPTRPRNSSPIAINQLQEVLSPVPGGTERRPHETSYQSKAREQSRAEKVSA